MSVENLEESSVLLLLLLHGISFMEYMFTWTCPSGVSRHCACIQPDVVRGRRLLGDVNAAVPAHGG